MNPISLPISELKPALAGLGKVISKRNTLPILSHVRIERTPTGHVELGVTDLDTALVARLDTPDQGEPVAFLVPYEELTHTAKGCRAGDTLILAPVAPQRVALKFPVAGQIIEHRCESLPVEEFPSIAEIRGEPITLDDSLRRSIHEALQCASTDDTRLILTGAFLDVSKPKAHYVVGTDGRHLFSSNSFELPLRESLLIPSHRFLEWKEFNADGDWQLKVNPKEKEDDPPPFEILSRRWRFVSRQIQGNYPNWRQVVPNGKGTQTTLEVEPKLVEAIMQTIARLPDHDAINHSLGVEIKDRHVRLLSKSAGDDQWTRLGLDGVKPLGRDVTVHLNRHLVTKALRFGLLKLEVIDSMSPVRFSAGGRQMIVMPVRPDSAPVQPTPPPPSAPAVQNESHNPNPPPPAEQPTKETMPNTNGAPQGAPESKAITTDKPALEIALAQIEVVRGDFRNAIAGLNKLGDLLKQVQRENKASEKEISSVRQTLRSLQTVRI
ncbi:MAG: DNA polymerase III subunit beta [Chthoniobacter sp.]|uniref:DNA polymerase III subunit beta n=1 Tax=Chthoniobacter sp. TaxID=2510640 RepID=UPI0032A41E0D